MGSFAVLPLIFLLVAGILIVRRRREAAIIGSIVVVVTALIGFWAISRSRSSTAAIGYLFLPSQAAVAGLLGVAYALGRASPRTVMRVLSSLSFAAAATIGCLEIWQGVSSIRLNRQRDALYERTR